MPGWVKALAAVVVLLILVAVLVSVLGEGQHGPGRHRAAPQTVTTAALADRGLGLRR